MKIINQTKETEIAKDGRIADTLFSRMKGLLGRDHLDSGEALLITRCQSIHMFFMKFAIDAIFIDRNHCVVGLVRRIKPFRLSACFFKAVSVIECSAGTIEATHTEIGDKISLEGH